MISEHGNSIMYSGDGETTAFSYPFDVAADTDIHVIFVDVDGAETEIESGFTVNTTTKEVFYPGYPPGQEPAELPEPVAAGEKICIYSMTPVAQEVDLPDKWPYDRIEAALDKLTVIEQQNRSMFGRAITLSPTADTENISLRLPAPKANQVIVWDKTGTTLTLDEYPSDMRETCVNSAAAADDAAANAANSERNAAASEENAAASAQDAQEAVQEAKDIAKVFGVAGEPYNPTKTYNLPDIVVLPDGSSWRCLQTSTGEYPAASSKWTAVTLAQGETFEYDEDGNLQPREYAQSSSMWQIDDDENIMPMEVIGA